MLVLLDSEKTVRETRPDFSALDRVECRGVIVTARGDRSDFVSRFFAPRVGIPEDLLLAPRIAFWFLIGRRAWQKRFARVSGFQAGRRVVL